MSTYNRGGPDWAICGMPAGDGVVVFASNVLDEGEFTARHDIVQHWNPFMGTGMGLAPKRYTLRVEGDELVVIEAPTYAEAMAKLMEHWTPERAKRPAIEPARPELPR